ncbi:CaiB/BaiF CoA transferase family protein [Oceanobacillus senegalensis]|uniref:CaiB/BaiF CoA transferase family protein n=1 Tax=Oceanobacillus senegalensis TaxID=1936063 RepID=UPI000A304D48|nr:CoA transferase [Oceanobacillus senegalensis]
MLEGIRVIDFTQYLPGPYATLRLADMGAEVIKVESPSGELGRYPTEKDGGPKYTFRAQNRGKKSISLNLKDEKEQEIARDLIHGSDVVIESFRPGVMKRLGISYKDVIKTKPDIIYCSLSGYGQTGDMKHLGSHDINYMAMSGVLSQMKDKQGVPIHPSITFADLIGGISASESISAALVQRERTGKGTYIDLALADIMVTIMTNHIMLESATGEQHGSPALNKTLICYYLYETKDGRFISLGALEAKFWENFCRAVNREDWISAQTSSPTQDNEIFQEVKELFLSRTFEEWLKFSQEVDCCMAPVLESGEVVNHPYYKERKLIEEKWGLRFVSTRYKDHPDLKDLEPAPGLGKHTDEIVRGITKV